jgi:hypothetical protein
MASPGNAVCKLSLAEPTRDALSDGLLNKTPARRKSFRRAGVQLSIAPLPVSVPGVFQVHNRSLKEPAAGLKSPLKGAGNFPLVTVTVFPASFSWLFNQTAGSFRDLLSIIVITSGRRARRSSCRRRRRRSPGRTRSAACSRRSRSNRFCPCTQPCHPQPCPGCQSPHR